MWLVFRELFLCWFLSLSRSFSFATPLTHCLNLPLPHSPSIPAPNSPSPFPISLTLLLPYSHTLTPQFLTVPLLHSLTPTFPLSHSPTQ